MDWVLIAGTFLNIVVVMVIVQALKTYVMPFLKTKYPWVLPILALVAGPAVTMAANWLTAYLGVPIDFTEIIGVLTGVSAVVMYTTVRAAKKKLAA